MGNAASTKKIPTVPTVPLSVTNPNARPHGLKYSRNEIFLIVNEQINLLANSNGEVIDSNLTGKFMVTTKLSGVPTVKISLSLPKKDFYDVHFHQCVYANNLDEHNKTLLFNPPDGKFELLSYSMPTVKKMPILIDSLINKKNNSITYTIILRENNNINNFTINDLEIIIPVPSDSSLIKQTLNLGTVTHQAETSSVVWTIEKLSKKYNSQLDFEMAIPILKNPLIDDYEKKPITVKFNIDFLTNSGLKVNFVKVSDKFDKNYSATSWIKYRLQNGDYFFTPFDI